MFSRVLTGGDSCDRKHVFAINGCDAGQIISSCSSVIGHNIRLLDSQTFQHNAQCWELQRHQNYGYPNSRCLHRVWNCTSDMQFATKKHSSFISIACTCGHGKTDRFSNSDTFTSMKKTTVLLYEAITCVLTHADQHKMQPQ